MNLCLWWKAQGELDDSCTDICQNKAASLGSIYHSAVTAGAYPPNMIEILHTGLWCCASTSSADTGSAGTGTGTGTSGTPARFKTTNTNMADVNRVDDMKQRLVPSNWVDGSFHDWALTLKAEESH